MSAAKMHCSVAPADAAHWYNSCCCEQVTRQRQTLEQAAQGGGEVPIAGGVQKPCGCGTWGHGLAGMVVMG